MRTEQEVDQAVQYEISKWNNIILKLWVGKSMKCVSKQLKSIEEKKRQMDTKPARIKN